MGVEWFRNDKQAVLDELRRGVRPLMAMSMASGPLDELVALHIELGVFGALDRLAVQRERAGIDDSLLFRTPAVLPFLPSPASTPRHGPCSRSRPSCSASAGPPPGSS